jgi:hypothetical protein
MSTGSLLRSQSGGGISEFMFIIHFTHYELTVLRPGRYDDVEAESGTRFHSHNGEGASVYHMNLSHSLANASRYQSIRSLAD